MTLYEAKKPYLEELGLLEQYKWSEDFKKLSLYSQEKLDQRLIEIEPIVELLTSIDSPGQKKKSIIMYDLDFNLLRQFRSTQDAALYLGLGKTVAPIRKVLNLERTKYREYIFRYTGSTLKTSINPKALTNGKSKAVIQMRINFKTGTYSEIKEFSSIKEAAEFINPDHISSASENISLCAQGKKEKYKEYAWRFKHKHTLEKYGA